MKTIPDHIKASIDAYVQSGRPTGGFLQACIENDLKGAIARADDESLALIPDIVRYLYNQCPAKCWGNLGVITKWIAHRGLSGLEI